MTPEAKIKKQVTAILKGLGVYYFFPATGGYGRSGVPDIICCVDGCFVGIECKAGTNKPTALQDREMGRIVSAGGYVYVAREDNLADILSALKGIMEQ